MDKLVRYSFIKVDGNVVNLEVENGRYSPEYSKNINDKKTCAYVVENVYEGKMYKYIKYKSGHIYDAFRSDDKGYRDMDWKYKKVIDSVFITYLKYLGILENFKKFKGKKFLLSQIENLLN